MRLLIRLGVFLAVIWCAWWALASYGVSRGVEAWIEARRAEGWQIEAQTEQGGFPLNIRTNVSALSFTNPVDGATLSAQGGRLSARTYWPGHLDLDLPDTPILFDGPLGQLALVTRNGGAKLRLHPGAALELGRVEVSSDGWQAKVDGAVLLQGDSLSLIADQTAKDVPTYAIALTAERLTPGTLARQLLFLPTDWPAAFDDFSVKGAVTFDAPLDRASIDGPPPQFRQITLEGAKIIWGAISLSAIGALDVDSAGIPEGEVILQAQNWRGLLDLAQSSGALPVIQRVQVELMLGALAQRSGDLQNLEIVLEFRNGQWALGGIELGDAPRLILR